VEVAAQAVAVDRLVVEDPEVEALVGSGNCLTRTNF
jgi:hypothetical protein